MCLGMTRIGIQLYLVIYMNSDLVKPKSGSTEFVIKRINQSKFLSNILDSVKLTS